MGLDKKQQSKSLDLKRKRRQFIVKNAIELTKNGTCDTMTEAYLYIADNMLFCCVDTIYRALRIEKQTVK